MLAAASEVALTPSPPVVPIPVSAERMTVAPDTNPAPSILATVSIRDSPCPVTTPSTTIDDPTGEWALLNSKASRAADSEPRTPPPIDSTSILRASVRKNKSDPVNTMSREDSRAAVARISTPPTPSASVSAVKMMSDSRPIVTMCELTTTSRRASSKIVVSLTRSAPITRSKLPPIKLRSPAPRSGVVFNVARLTSNWPPLPNDVLTTLFAVTTKPELLVISIEPPAVKPSPLDSSPSKITLPPPVWSKASVPPTVENSVTVTSVDDSWCNTTGPDVLAAARLADVNSKAETSPIPLPATKLTTPPSTSTAASAVSDSLIESAEMIDTVSSDAVTESIRIEPLVCVNNDTCRPVPPAVTTPTCRSEPVLDREMSPSTVVDKDTVTAPPPV